jgi:hypothetical protein
MARTPQGNDPRKTDEVNSRGQDIQGWEQHEKPAAVGHYILRTRMLRQCKENGTDSSSRTGRVSIPIIQFREDDKQCKAKALDRTTMPVKLHHFDHSRGRIRDTCLGGSGLRAHHASP